MERRYSEYNKKCQMICFRLRKDKDDKYLEFLRNCPNKTQFLKDAIDRALNS